MRYVRRRGLSWKEAADKAAQQQKLDDDAALGIEPGDKWASLIRELKHPKNTDEDQSHELNTIDQDFPLSFTPYRPVSTLIVG